MNKLIELKAILEKRIVEAKEDLKANPEDKELTLEEILYTNEILSIVNNMIAEG